MWNKKGKGERMHLKKQRGRFLVVSEMSLKLFFSEPSASIEKELLS